jgi:isoleucyl-tRNA synthetase
MLEAARTDKLVGASLEASAFLCVPNPAKRKNLERLVGDDHLVTPPVKTNGVDDLRTALMLSRIHLVDSESEISSECDDRYIHC